MNKELMHGGNVVVIGMKTILAMGLLAVSEIGFARTVIVLEFNSQSATLTDRFQRALESTFDCDRYHACFDKVKIMSWGDRPTPHAREVALKTDKSLAWARASNIKRLIPKKVADQIMVYNMAMPPSFLGQMFGTEEALLKNLETKANRKTNQKVTPSLLRIHRLGGPQRAVVVIPANDRLAQR